MGRWCAMVRYVVKSDYRGRWVVYRKPSHREGATCPERWTPTEKWFDTWREAIDYADKRSRTVEVVLPAPEAHPPVDLHRPAWHTSESLNRPWVSVMGRRVWMTEQRGWGDHLDAYTAEKLGLALLAAAKHAKGELP